MKEIKLTIEGKTNYLDLIRVLTQLAESLEISGLKDDEYTDDDLVINLVVS
jgi:hypothetical protein